jgi:DNA-binding response OmpR family regulator
MRCPCGASFVAAVAGGLAPEKQARPDAPVRALVVEPHDDTRELYSETLASEGVDVAAAPTLQQATRHVREWRPTIVSTELWLPDGDALVLCRQLRNLPQPSRVPVLIVTAETRPARLAEAGRMVASVLVKPCPPDVYLTAMLNLAGHTAGGKRAG